MIQNALGKNQLVIIEHRTMQNADSQPESRLTRALLRMAEIRKSRIDDDTVELACGNVSGDQNLIGRIQLPLDVPDRTEFRYFFRNACTIDGLDNFGNIFVRKPRLLS